MVVHIFFSFCIEKMLKPDDVLASDANIFFLLTFVNMENTKIISFLVYIPSYRGWKK